LDKKSYLFEAQKATEIGTAVLISPQVTWDINRDIMGYLSFAVVALLLRRVDEC
jgi:hypothetical protein